ncbi:MAG: fumarate reductase flavoprotein subunit, partial [Myxococcota bacterium]
MLWLLACAPPSSQTPDLPSGLDSGAPPDAVVDVLVIGSGPAGLSAAIAAGDAGASVLVIEREATAGGAGWYGSGFFAAGTDWQADEGITDTPTDALAEWADFTGGDGADPQVVQLV